MSMFIKQYVNSNFLSKSSICIANKFVFVLLIRQNDSDKKAMSEYFKPTLEMHRSVNNANFKSPYKNKIFTTYSVIK